MNTQWRTRSVTGHGGVTHERAVRRAAGLLYQDKRPEFIMRPEFLLNYIALVPTRSEVIKSYGSVFPTMLAVKLSQRLEATALRSTLTEVKKAFQIDQFRARAMIAEMLKKLPADHLRIYDHDLETLDPFEEVLSDYEDEANTQHH